MTLVNAFGTLLTNEQLRASAVPVTDVQSSTTGTLTANGSVVTFDSGTQATIATLFFYGTYSLGATLVFEVSPDNVNWFSILAQRGSDGSVASSTAPTANLSNIWDIPLQAARYVRVRVSAWAAPTGAISIQFVGVHGSDPIGTNVPNGTQTVQMSTPTAYVLANSLATTNGVNVKASAGTVYNISATNLAASIKYLKLYNVTTTPTVGTTIPVLTIPLPANTFTTFALGTDGIRLTTGLGIAITGAAGDTDTTAIAAGDVKLHIAYT